MGNCAAPPDTDKRVVVIGGGYAGQAISSLLDPDFFVTVIDPRDKLVHKIGGVRACVRKEWTDAILIPQDKVLTRGRRTKASAISMDMTRRKISLDNGLVISYDFLVIASGGQSNSPTEPNSLNLVSHYTTIAAQIESANHILLIGGGPVAVELSGEILSKYPSKKVSIVHSGPHLCSNITGPASPDFSAAILLKLTSKGVEIHLGDSIASKTEGIVTLKSGVTKAIDLIYDCAGYIPNTAFVPKALKNDLGRIRVDAALKVVGTSNVFAIGDCNDVEETKTFVAAGTQEGKMDGWPKGHADVVAENIRNIRDNKSVVSVYTPPKGWFGMIVPIGPDDSVVAGYPEAFGAYKASSYFIGAQWEASRLPAPILPQL